MRKLAIYAVLVLALLVMAAGCTQSPPNPTESEEAVVQINPLAESVSVDEITARLYYGFGDECLLAGQTRRIQIPANESADTSILNELIQEGPSTSSVNLTRVIDPSTRVISVSSDGEYMTVTFSREFLRIDRLEAQYRSITLPERTRRYLSVYSVVNTLIERGTCSRVRIMIDEDGTGTGRPITCSEAGISGTGDAEPFAHNADIELTPNNTMREILQGVEKRDWAQVYDFIAMKNQRGQDRPSLDEFTAQVERMNTAVSDSKVLDYIMTPDGTGAVIMISYDLNRQGGEPVSYSNVPKRLELESDVWKMTWNVFEQTFLA